MLLFIHLCHFICYYSSICVRSPIITRHFHPLMPWVIVVVCAGRSKSPGRLIPKLMVRGAGQKTPSRKTPTTPFNQQDRCVCMCVCARVCVRVCVCVYLVVIYRSRVMVVVSCLSPNLLLSSLLLKSWIFIALITSASSLFIPGFYLCVYGGGGEGGLWRMEGKK